MTTVSRRSHSGSQAMRGDGGTHHRHRRSIRGALAKITLGFLAVTLVGVAPIGPGLSPADAASLTASQVIFNTEGAALTQLGTVMAQDGNTLAISYGGGTDDPTVVVYSRAALAEPWTAVEAFSSTEPGWGRALALRGENLAISTNNSVSWFTGGAGAFSENGSPLVRDSVDFGRALAFDRFGTLLVGAPNETPGSNSTGVVFPVVLGDGGPEISDGQDVLDPDTMAGEGDQFGWTIEAVDETTGFGEELTHVYIGSPGNDDTGQDAGAIYRYSNPSSEGFFFNEKITEFGDNDQAGFVLAADPVNLGTIAVGIATADKAVVLEDGSQTGAIDITALAAPNGPFNWLDMRDGLIAVGLPSFSSPTGGTVELYAYDGSQTSLDTPLHTFTPDDTDADDVVGGSLLLDEGPNLIAAAPGFDFESDAIDGSNAGQVYYVQTGAAPPPPSTPNLPTGLDVDAGWAAIGDPDKDEVYIGRFQGDEWVNTQLISGPSNTGFGAAVALDGPVLVVGSPLEAGLDGRVRVFLRNAAGNYAETSAYTTIASGGLFGASVDVKGRVVVGGAPRADSDRGVVSVATLDASYTISDLANFSSAAPDEGFFGSAVALASDDELWVGSQFHGLDDSGRVGFWERSGATWTENGAYELFSPDNTNEGLFGASVAVDGDHLVVGEPTEDGGPGTAWYYPNPLANASEFEKLTDTEGDSIRFGTSVAVSGDIVAVGASGGTPGMSVYSALEFGNEIEFVTRVDAPDGGAERVAADGPHQILSLEPSDANADNFTNGSQRFSFVSTGVSPTQKIISSVGSEGDRFGADVALLDDRLIVLAPDASANQGNGLVEVFGLSGSSFVSNRVLVPQDLGTNAGFTTGVVADGDLLATLADGQLQVFRQASAGAPYTLVTDVADGGTHIEMNQDVLVTGDGSQIRTYSNSDGVLTFEPNLSFTADHDSFSLDGVVLALGKEGPPNVGEVTVYELGSTWTTWGTFGDGTLEFGRVVDVFGHRMAVGGDNQVTIISDILSSTPDTEAVLAGPAGANFGFEVALGGDRLVVAQRANLESDPGPLRLEFGLAFYGFDGGGWSPTGTYVQENQAQNFAADGIDEDDFGVSLSLSGNDRVAVGAPAEDEAGDNAGAVFVLPVPDPPTVEMVTDLSVTVSPGSPQVPVGAQAVATANLPPQASEGAGGGNQGIADVSLGTVADEDGDNRLLDETEFGELNLPSDLLNGILLSDVPIVGGWGPVLAGSPLANQPIQSVTLGDVLAAGLIDDLDLNRLDLSATPIGAVPIGAIGIADTPIGAVQLPSGQTVCELAEELVPGFVCSDDFSLIDLGIRGVPIGAVPIGAVPVVSIPIGAVPIGAVNIAGTPIGAVPIGAVDIAGTPIGAVPIGAVDLASTPIGAVPIGAVPIGAIPIGAIDLAATPIGAVTIGQLDTDGIAGSPIGAVPIGAVPIGAVPIGAVPIGAVELSGIPIGAVPIGAVDIAGSPIGAVPIGAIDLEASPIGAVPIGAVDVAGSPIGAVPIGAIDIGSIPIGAVPIGAVPIGAVPIGAIHLEASPIGAVPIGAVAPERLTMLVDCSLIDCFGDATLADAAAAGALLPTATIGLFSGSDTGLRFADLVGLGGFTEEQIRAQIDAIADFALADFLTFDDMTLADLPAGYADVARTTLAELGEAALALISLQDLIDSIADLTEEQIRTQLTDAGVLTIAQLANRNGMVLEDLLSDPVDPNLAALTIAQLLPFMEGVRLGDLLDIHPTLSAEDIDWGESTMANVADWEDVTLEELAEFAGTTLEELLTNLDPAVLETLTLGDILLGLLGIDSYDWAEIDLRSLDLPPAGTVEINTDFSVTGANANVRLQVILPPGSAYVEGSAVLSGPPGADQVSGVKTPTVTDNIVEFQLGGIEPDLDYQLTVETSAGLRLGNRTIEARGRVAGTDIQSGQRNSLAVIEAFEPNDNTADATEVQTDTVYVSHLSSADDIDVFKIDLEAGARLALSLSDLPDDYDLAVFGPADDPLVPLGEQEITPTEPPRRVGFAGSENSNKPGSLADLPRQGSLPIISVSNQPDTTTEIIDIPKTRRAGTYYIQVSGHSGAFSPEPYGLFVNVVDPAPPLQCVAQDYSSEGNVGAVPSTGDMAGVDTLILTNRERLFGKYGADASTAVAAMDDLVAYLDANPGLGMKAAVVNVDGDSDVRAAFANLDDKACDPQVVNDTVREIASLVGELRGADPTTTIDNIIIVGDDDVVPFARLADDTTIANETSFAWTFQGTEANTLFGVAAGAYYLSDEPYGDLDPIKSGKRTLFVTDTSLGRLVETPGEIAGQIATYIAFDGTLSPTTGYVSGYDFLSDGAQSVTDELANLPDIDPVDSLISEAWTRSDLDGDLFPAGDSPDIGAINAHFDQYRAQPADQSAAGLESELFTTEDVNQPGREDDLLGRILFSMGCHGGLHVPDELFPTDDVRALDWAQTFSRQRAVWVGNTGYGYGETEGVELTERLMALFAANLDGSVSVGEALLYAKQTYVGTRQAEYGPFDEKVLQQSTFYGLPIYKVGVATPPAPEPIPELPGLFPLSDTALALTTISSGPTFDRIENSGGTTFEASLPEADAGVTRQQSTPYAPILPIVSYDVSAVSEDGTTPVAVAQGAFITGLRTSDVEGVEPDIARPIVDLAANEGEPKVNEIGTDPTVFISNYRTPEGPRQQLSALAATFRTTEPDGRGVLRLFEDLEFEVFYRDVGSGADQQAPLFRGIQSQVQTAGEAAVLVISARVVDPSGVERVQALVGQNPGADTTWTAVELTQQGPLLWSGSLELTAAEVEFFVQALDGNGNVALSTNKSDSYLDDTEPEPEVDSIDATPSRGPDAGVFYTSAVSVSASAGGEPIEFRIDAGPLQDGGSNPVVTLDPVELGDGAHSVTFVLANGDEETVVALFDTEGPIISVSPSTGSEVESPVTIRYSCGDAASGIATCAASIAGDPVSDGQVLDLAPGQYSLAVSAADALGNQAGTSSVFVVTASNNPEDADEDGVPDVDDNCVDDPNPNQEDGDDDGIGDACDPDQDDGPAGDPDEDGLSNAAEAEIGTDPANPDSDDDGVNDGDEVAAGTDPLTPDNPGLVCTLTGTPANNLLIGTDGPDVICGLGGNDRIYGLGGDDILIGGDGNDLLVGGGGDDTTVGEGGNDRMYGGPGIDTMIGGEGADLLVGNDDPDMLAGGPGNDVFYGGRDADEIFGGDGDDRIFANSGDDVAHGNGGADLLHLGSGDDIGFGGAGADTIFGNAGNDEMSGGPGMDRIVAGNGNDILNGDEGDDRLFGQNGNDALDGGPDVDRCRGDRGTDTEVNCET